MTIFTGSSASVCAPQNVPGPLPVRISHAVRPSAQPAVLHGDDVLVLADACRDARLADEPVAQDLVAHEVGAHELQRGLALGLRVDRVPHHRHAALAEDRLEPITAPADDASFGSAAH